jgi:DNA-binding MarR family transcriptional regulator
MENSISSSDHSWRVSHLGRLMGNALRRFDERVLQLMAKDVLVPLALSNLAARDQVGAAHIHITRHLAVGGSRLTELASSAGMSKQAMGDLVTQCEAWGLVTREPDLLDRRARQVVFTASGMLWLQAFERAITQAESEFKQAVGADVATVVALGLEAYGSA